MSQPQQNGRLGNLVSARNSDCPTITVMPGNIQIPCCSDLTILEAARESGVTIDAGCQAGICATCIARLVSGTVDPGEGEALTPSEIGNGMILCCQARPTESVTIEIT